MTIFGRTMKWSCFRLKKQIVSKINIICFFFLRGLVRMLLDAIGNIEGICDVLTISLN